MKNYIYSKLGLAFTVCAFMFSSNTHAQLKANQTLANASINNSTAFLDAASSTIWNASTTLGKGMLFPRADLSALVLTNNGGFLAGNNPNRFDGLIIYNTGTGVTPAVGSGIGNQTVTPGFYYFSNPGTPSGIATGQWLPLGGTSPKLTIKTTETTTNTLINTPSGDKQLYAIKGQFTASGTTTGVSIPAPAGITAMYAITIYKAGTNTVYDRSLYSYDTTSGNAVTGSPNMSVVYPNGTYDYVLEYLK